MGDGVVIVDDGEGEICACMMREQGCGGVCGPAVLDNEENVV